ncbi:hypothetical protein O988_03565 [Pseudogymnoascus sp. VKM F-3808]|nr:hypothetical protein O988_03565 [Pseudogymnoascus sp. VKM F-3808]
MIYDDTREAMKAHLQLILKDCIIFFRTCQPQDRHCRRCSLCPQTHRTPHLRIWQRLYAIGCPQPQEAQG